MSKRAEHTGTQDAFGDDVEVLTDPLDEWIAEHSEEWSEQYPGKYLDIHDFRVEVVEDDPGLVYDRLVATHPDQSPTVLYVPRKDELEMLL